MIKTRQGLHFKLGKFPSSILDNYIIKYTFMNKEQQVRAFIYNKVKTKEYFTLPWNAIHKFPELSIKTENVPRYQSIPKNRMSESLYPYQEEIRKFLYDKLNKYSQAYLQLPTGLGKTRIAVGMISVMKCKTLVVVPTIAIANQWIKEIQDHTPYTVKKVSKTELNDAQVTVGVVNSVREMPSENFNFDFHIYDEAHEYYTQSNIRVLWEHAPYMLGLSATPLERKDQFDKLVTFFLGDVYLASDITHLEMKEFNGSVKQIRYKVPKEYNEIVLNPYNNIIHVGLTIQNILKDPQRLNHILNEIELISKQHQGVLVFAEMRQYLEVLYSQFSERTDKKCMILYGGSTQKEVNMVKNMNVVFTTYGYSRRGVSFAHMTALVLATPRANGLNQIIGRILRLGDHDHVHRKIIDFVDYIDVFIAQSNKRKEIYKEKKYRIEIVTIKN